MADIFAGGFGDGDTGKAIVGSYVHTYAATHEGAKYFDWDQAPEILKYLDALPPTEQVDLIGHRYGGDTVANIAARYGRRINVLVTIDPVGHTGKATLGLIKSNSTVWVDVSAKPKGWFNGSNIVAGIGSDWGDAPKGIAGVYIEAPFDHEQFEPLVNAPGPDGLSAAMILERDRAAAAILAPVK
jgi:pimeloyl-ACP methyl ester carboxylesterase